MLRKEAVLPEVLSMIKNIQKEDLFQNYILAGGTALALQLGHRSSEDIDLFKYDNQDCEKMINYFNQNYKSVDIIANQPWHLKLEVNNIKIDLCALKDCPIVKPLVKDEDITMFDSEEIAVMKISAICDRKEPKDYIDIAYMLDKKTSLENILNLYMKKYKKYSIMYIKKNLSAYTSINPYKWQDVNIIDHNFFISNVPNIIDSALKEYNKKYNIKEETLLNKLLRIFIKKENRE